MPLEDTFLREKMFIIIKEEIIVITIKTGVFKQNILNSFQKIFFLFCNWFQDSLLELVLLVGGATISVSVILRSYLLSEANFKCTCFYITKTIFWNHHDLTTCYLFLICSPFIISNISKELLSVFIVERIISFSHLHDLNKREKINFFPF